ncbi:outer membrane protein with beta-barrel domain [Spirosoma oryzae]|uniref:Outer membrane protein with beta-barrel domain n=1 Tax=Spirosoma oryzae TaxID=1469603 RepID=A0A2T0SGK6_9BACT|nr:porin family protein [Spirosoma oryzae]PRY32548.1 outer membrane protein with beta-barrel domain [Spirosoma oryzae]
MRKALINRLAIIVGVILVSGAAVAQVSPYRFEVEAGGGLLRLPDVAYNGWSAKQQLTAYIKPRLGVSVGINWAGTTNTAPLSYLPNQYGLPNPARLNEFYVRTDRMLDLSAVILPILTRHHQVSVRVGLSAYRSKTTQVDSLIYPNPRDRSSYETVLDQRTTDRVSPLLGVGYDYRLSNRWSVGAYATAYLNAPDKQTVSTFGLRSAYRFNISADSLGLSVIDKSTIRTGIRLAGNVSASNERTVADVYSIRGIGGVWAEVPLSLTWQFRTELNYAQRSGQTNEVRTGRVRFLPGVDNRNYLEIPLLFRNEVAYKWHLYVGPYFATLLNGRAELDGKLVAVVPHSVVGVMLGADYQLSDRFSVDARYQRDLVQLSSRPYGGLHGFQLGLNWAFQRSNQ